MNIYLKKKYFKIGCCEKKEKAQYQQNTNISIMRILLKSEKKNINQHKSTDRNV